MPVLSVCPLTVCLSVRHLQMLFHVNEFRGGVYTLPFQEQVLSESTTLAMQSVFSKLQVRDSGDGGGEGCLGVHALSIGIVTMCVV